MNISFKMLSYFWHLPLCISIHLSVRKPSQRNRHTLRRHSVFGCVWYPSVIVYCLPTALPHTLWLIQRFLAKHSTRNDLNMVNMQESLTSAPLHSSLLLSVQLLHPSSFSAEPLITEFLLHVWNTYLIPVGTSLQQDFLWPLLLQLDPTIHQLMNGWYHIIQQSHHYECFIKLVNLYICIYIWMCVCVCKISLPQETLRAIRPGQVPPLFSLFALFLPFPVLTAIGMK